MDAAATQIRDLCKNILEFSRSGAVIKKRRGLRTRCCAARRLVLKDRFVADRARDRASSSTGRVPCAGPLIEQILINLLDNAAFAARPAARCS